MWTILQYVGMVAVMLSVMVVGALFLAYLTGRSDRPGRSLPTVFELMDRAYEIGKGEGE